MDARLNPVIRILEQGGTAFGTFVSVHSIDKTIEADDLGFDFVIYDMEHSPLDFHNLRIAMQFLLNRAKIAADGTLRPTTAPLVRIPPKGAEDFRWQVKQALDQGAYGILVPHVATAEQARDLVEACRYATPTNPTGQRGCGPFVAARYWGLPWPEYTKRAEPWPLSPSGELAVIPLIENLEGVANIDAILAGAPGITAVFFGPGDLSVELGVPGQVGHPKVEAAFQTVLAACKRHGIACAAIADEHNVAQRINEGCRIVVTMPRAMDPGLAAGRARVAQAAG